MTMNDDPDVYAVPGQNSIIDIIRPDGLTAVYSRDLDDIRREYPTAERMTWHAWRTAAIARQQQTPLRWEPTTGQQYQTMLEVLPPAFWQGGAFLVGEPDDHDFATGQPRYRAYRHSHGRYYVSSRPVTVTELQAILNAR